MNTKNIIFFLVGLGLGAGASALFFKKFYEKRCAEDVNELKEEYKAERQKMIETRARLINEVESVNAIGKKIVEENLKVKAKPDTAKTDYGSYFEHDRAEEESPEEVSEDEERYLKNKQLNDMRGDTSKHPEIISENEYGENPIYESFEYTYYYNDGILADENDEDVEDPIQLTGGLLIESGFEENDDDTIYIRNYELGLDMCITKSFSAYSDIMR